MNQVTLCGRMTKDFEAGSNGKTGMGTIAVERPYPFKKDKDGNKVTDFLTLKAIGEKNVEKYVRFLRKGIKVIVTGVYARDTYKDKDGNNKEFNSVMLTGFEFAESKNSGGTADKATETEDFMKIDSDTDSDFPFE